MSLFCIADTHLSLGTDKPMDIFSGWDNYVDQIASNWNRLVAPDDLVVIAGDISWGMKLEECREDFAFLDRLPGQKWILKGNHDYWFSTKAKVEQYLAAQGFSTLHILHNNAVPYGDYCICGTRGWLNEKGENPDKKIINREAGRLRMSLEAGRKLGGEPIVFLHYPPIYGTGDRCEEILNVLHEFEVRRCYYGHLHGKSCNYAVNGVREQIDFQLISCDYIQFAPVKVM